MRYIGTDPAGHSTDRAFTTTQARPAYIDASGAGPLTCNGTVDINGNEGEKGGTIQGSGVGIANGKITIGNYDGNDLVISAIPEPTSVLLLGLSSLALLRRRRR